MAESQRKELALHFSHLDLSSIALDSIMNKFEASTKLPSDKTYPRALLALS